MIQSAKKISAIVIIVLLFVMLPILPMPKASAASTPYITFPFNKSQFNAYSPVTVEWNPPDGVVAKYIISVRHLSDGSGEKDTLIVNQVSLSATTTSYTIPWSKLTTGSCYRISVCAVLSSGTKKWSNEVYFFTACYKVRANETYSFYIYSGFPNDWKDAFYYAAQAWNNVMPLNYEVVNTYPYSQCHSINRISNNDLKNHITWVAELDDDLGMITRTSMTLSGTIIEIDINVNASVNFGIGALSDSYDVQSFMTHEMGHASGMAHCYEDFASEWTMFGKGAKNTIKQRSLTIDDEELFYDVYLNV